MDLFAPALGMCCSWSLECSLPWVWNRVQGNDCPVAASVDTSQNCSPGWNFSSHHCSPTAQWLVHMARISDSRYLLHKRGCANRRNYFLSFLYAPSDTTLMARTVQHTLFMSVYFSGVWPSNCFSIVRLHGCTPCLEQLRRNINLQFTLACRQCWVHFLTGYVNQVSHSCSCKSGIVINTHNERANYYWHVSVLCFSLFWEPNPTIWKNVA